MKKKQKNDKFGELKGWKRERYDTQVERLKTSPIFLKKVRWYRNGMIYIR